MNILSVEEEYEAPGWWAAARAAVEEAPAKVRTWILSRGQHGSCSLSEEETEQFLAWAKGLPGWADGPEHAPHAVFVFDERDWD